MWYALLDPLLPDGNHEVLDVGCGIGAYYDLLTGKAEKYVGIDPTEEMIKRARELHPHGDFRTGTVYELRFPNERFRLVFCWSVLVHLPHKTIKRAIRELWRVTKKYLFLNLYVASEDDSFSVRGPWGEYLTAMDKWDIGEIFESLKPKSIQRTNYEGVDLLDNKKFQRTIFLLTRGGPR